MGAFKGVSQFFKRPLSEVATEFNYTEDNILILREDESGLMRKYPDIYANIRTCIHHADRRSYFEYAMDLVASWLMEDYLLKTMSSDSYEIVLNGADKERRILPSAKTSTSSDFLITKHETRISIEIMNDYTGFWKKHRVLHLRDTKYQSLQRAKSLFIAIATSSGEFAIYDFRKSVAATRIPSHRPYGFKPAYELQMPVEMLKPITSDSIKMEIAKLIQ